MDVHVHGGITAELRVRGIDVLTSQEDRTHQEEDEVLLTARQSLAAACLPTIRTYSR
jgi:hypothetical protein